MNRFASLLDSLAYEPSRNGKLRLIDAYLRTTPDPDRGWALAALTGSLRFAQAKPAMVRDLIASRVDPVLFSLSYDYVGDLSETVALLWPAPHGVNTPPPPLSEVVEALATTTRAALPDLLRHWLDALDETGRWALLKLITGSLRIGVSARLAKTAVAGLGGLEPDSVEEVWHGLQPPYLALFAWVEGRGPAPEARDPAPFRPPMLAHPLDEADHPRINPAQFAAEWKWDGIRVQVTGGETADGRVVRLYSRSGDDISTAFPDVIGDLLSRPSFAGALDGELLVLRDGRVASFNELQQRLNRKLVSPRMMRDFPVGIRAYDLLVDGEEDIRPLPFEARRSRLEAAVARIASPMLDLSPLVSFADLEELARLRLEPGERVNPDDAPAIEGFMLKRLDSPYLPGRPKGLWFKWKRDPFVVDTVLMYAQRGHGKRSSFYSDFTFGVWRGEGADAELVPVGKAYFGFTDAELMELDRFVRRNTVNRFGPVREVTHTRETGLVLEVAFEGLQESTRHKSGIAMRFPRVSRIRWDKPPAEADHIGTLQALLKSRAAPEPIATALRMQDSS
jgi:DNA ligase-1